MNGRSTKCGEPLRHSSRSQTWTPSGNGTPPWRQRRGPQTTTTSTRPHHMHAFLPSPTGEECWPICLAPFPASVPPFEGGNARPIFGAPFGSSGVASSNPHRCVYHSPPCVAPRLAQVTSSPRFFSSRFLDQFLGVFRVPHSVIARAPP